MRLSIIIILIATVLAGTLVWYAKTANICPVPLSYRLGQLDSEFNLTAEKAQTYFDDAEKIWEGGVGRELFVYDENADLTINFIFDERQAMSDAEATARAELDAKEEENDKISATLDTLKKQYKNLESSHQTKISNYEARLSSYNEEVRMYNDRNGAPANVFARLQEEKDELNQEATELTALANELNEVASKINELSERGNALIEAYNLQVGQYNNRFGKPEEFTQGDYQGNEIHVYKFADDVELVSVLAHEFGHALGIEDHVEGTSSIMYYLLEEERTEVSLSEEDKSAFSAVCGSGNEIEHRLRRIIREILTTINL